MNIVLIGYRGTGKTTVAKLLAQHLQRPWQDADMEIEAQAGCTIAEIFANQGEKAFRDWESKVIDQLSCQDNCVLALGGGAVLREKNRQAIAQRGKVFWLQASAETIHRRVSQDATTTQRRPNLTTRGGLDEIEELLQKRAPVYRDCADHEVDTEGKSPTEVVNEILSKLAAPSVDNL